MVDKTGAYGSLIIVIVVLTVWTLWESKFGSMADPTQNNKAKEASLLELPEIMEVDLVRVVDGDTIKVKNNGEEIGVRLIGVDTPETKHPTKGVECFGPEATEFLRNNITRSLRLESDETQAEIDKYGRYLRYVYTDDGILLNELLIEQGYGNEYTYKDPYLLQDAFREAEDVARFTEQGLWGEPCLGG